LGVFDTKERLYPGDEHTEFRSDEFVECAADGDDECPCAAYLDEPFYFPIFHDDFQFLI
jgi:hypothetical protein